MYRTFMTWQFPAQLENGILVEASAGSASDDRADLAARWSRDVSVVSALRALELVAAPDRLLCSPGHRGPAFGGCGVVAGAAVVESAFASVVILAPLLVLLRCAVLLLHGPLVILGCGIHGAR